MYVAIICSWQINHSEALRPDTHMYRYNKIDMRDFIARVKSFMTLVTRTNHTLFGQRLGGTSTQLARR